MDYHKIVNDCKELNSKRNKSFLDYYATEFKDDSLADEYRYHRTMFKEYLSDLKQEFKCFVKNIIIDGNSLNDIIHDIILMEFQNDMFKNVPKFEVTYLGDVYSTVYRSRNHYFLVEIDGSFYIETVSLYKDKFYTEQGVGQKYSCII